MTYLQVAYGFPRDRAMDGSFHLIQLRFPFPSGAVDGTSGLFKNSISCQVDPKAGCGPLVRWSSLSPGCPLPNLQDPAVAFMGPQLQGPSVPTTKIRSFAALAALFLLRMQQYDLLPGYRSNKDSHSFFSKANAEAPLRLPLRTLPGVF